MSNLASKLFKGKANTKITERGNAFEEGEFIAEIVKLLVIETFDNGPAFIAEFKVVSSNLPNVKPGAARSWFQGMNGKQATVGVGQVFKLCYAAEGIDRRALSDEEKEAVQGTFSEALSDLKDDLYVGKTVKVVAKGKPGKGDKANMVYVNPEFYPLDAA